MHFDFKGFDEALAMIDRIDADRIAKKALDAASPILEKSLIGKIRAAANRGYSKGASGLAGHIKTIRARKNQYGVFAAVIPYGANERGVRYAEELTYLEYGVPGKQEARPVRTKAVNAVEDECIKIMEQVIEEEVGKL